MQKTALVLSGGGMFGAYQAGAWQVLEQSFHPDIVVGTSVGALNAWAIAGGCPPAELARAWLDPACATICTFRLTRTGILDPDPLRARIRELHGAWRPRTGIGVVAVDLLGLKARLFRDAEIEPQHLAAACAVLFCYPQIRIGGRWYTDGGLLNALPVWAALEMGATSVVAINLLPRAPLAIRLALRVIRRFASRPPAVPREVPAVTVMPERPLGTVRESLFWSREAAARWIEQGRKDAARAAALLSDNGPLCRFTRSTG